MRLETYIISFAINSHAPKFDSPEIKNLSEYHPGGNIPIDSMGILPLTTPYYNTLTL